MVGAARRPHRPPYFRFRASWHYGVYRLHVSRRVVYWSVRPSPRVGPLSLRFSATGPRGGLSASRFPGCGILVGAVPWPRRRIIHYSGLPAPCGSTCPPFSGGGYFGRSGILATSAPLVSDFVPPGAVGVYRPPFSRESTLAGAVFWPRRSIFFIYGILSPWRGLSVPFFGGLYFGRRSMLAASAPILA